MMMTVKKVKPMDVVVMLPSGTTASIHVSEIEESPVVGSFPTSSLKVGSKVEARVIGGRTVGGHKFLPISHPNFKVSLPELTLLPSKLNDADKKTIHKLNYKPGDEVICFASKQAKHPQTLFKLRQTISAKVVGLGTSRPFRLSLSLTGTYKLEQGVITMTKIRKIVSHMGLFLQLPFKNSGLASVMDLSDAFKDNPLEPYKLGQLVRCYIIGEENGKFNVSLCPSRLYKDHNKNLTDPDIQSISNIKEGQIIRGYVTSITDLGIFVRLSRTISGRVLFQNTTEYFVNDQKTFSEHISTNALLTAKVLSVNTKNEHVNLSLLSKDTGKPDLLPESLELPLRLTKQEQKQTQERDKKATKRKRVNSESQQQDDENNEQTIKKKKEGPVKGKSTEKQKRLKEETKTEDNDSGVEVFFREEEETPLRKNQDQVKVTHLQRRAIQYCEPLPMYQQLADIYAKSDKIKEAENLYKSMVKRFKQEKAAYLIYVNFLLGQHQSDAANALLQRALQSLSNKEHVDLIAKFARLEFQYGNAERAKSMFDKVLSTYSKRTDLWSVFIDLMVKHGSQKEVRKLFDHVINLSASVKKIKFFFKRYLEYEKKNGTPEAIQVVKQKALEYVESKGAEAAS